LTVGHLVLALVLLPQKISTLHLHYLVEKIFRFTLVLTVTYIFFRKRD
jgi:hypothetical protein